MHRVDNVSVPDFQKIAEKYCSVIRHSTLLKKTGKVVEFLGSVVESEGPDVSWGELCEIKTVSGESTILAEVVGIKKGKVLLMPYSPIYGVKIGSEVIATGKVSQIAVGEELVGRVIDAFGEPLDDKPSIEGLEKRSIYAEPPKPLKRAPINQVLESGIKVIDSLMTIGHGQRVGIFAGSGVGKSTLLGMIAKNLNADVNVIAMIGERGREVRDFIENILGRDGLAKSIVIVATSDQSALVRTHAALAATTIAEYFREQGKNVVLTMDSITRFAMAQREIGMARGEPPTSKGYTPSVFSSLPKLLERAGGGESAGSITGLYTVLVEADDVNDPIADHVRSIVDGGIYLSRKLANKRHFPAIDVLHSQSRLLNHLAKEEEISEASKLISDIDAYEQARDMIEIGAYKSGNNTRLDKIVNKWSQIEKFLTQTPDLSVRRSESIQALRHLNRK
jgi:flagellum-specific ATP synthase